MCTYFVVIHNWHWVLNYGCSHMYYVVRSINLSKPLWIRKDILMCLWAAKLVHQTKAQMSHFYTKPVKKSWELQVSWYFRIYFMKFIRGLYWQTWLKGCRKTDSDSTMLWIKEDKLKMTFHTSTTIFDYFICPKNGFWFENFLSKLNTKNFYLSFL